MPHVPVAMISSTYYDLKQIRKDIADFFEDDLGYGVLRSETDSFPIDPDVGTVENCRRRVEEHADILVLVVGGRYGYVDKAADKSVTNLEYSSARAKGIPIYVFIDKRVLALLPVWESNRSADYSSVVDNPRLFDFIQQIRSIDNVWTHEFENAQNVISALREQLAYMMLKGLSWTLRVNRHYESNALDGLTGSALRCALEQPSFWEVKLFAYCLTGELDSALVERSWQESSIAIGSGESIRDSIEAMHWIEDRLLELQRLIDAINHVMSVALRDAMSTDGVPGDIRKLRHAARMAGDVYKKSLAFSQRVRRLHVTDEWADVITAFSEESGEIATFIAELPTKTLAEIETFVSNPTTGPNDRLNINITLQVDFHRSTAAINQVVSNLRATYGE